jgi:hypothetical protein
MTSVLHRDPETATSDVGDETVVPLMRPLLLSVGDSTTSSSPPSQQQQQSPVLSRTNSSVYNEDDNDIPTNVCSVEQLGDLPDECLSGDPIRPLQHFDEDGRCDTYALNPMLYSVFMILLTEGIERFAFYGINYTQTLYLTGAYDKDWNADMEAIPASSVRV